MADENHVEGPYSYPGSDYFLEAIHRLQREVASAAQSIANSEDNLRAAMAARDRERGLYMAESQAHVNTIEDLRASNEENNDLKEQDLHHRVEIEHLWETGLDLRQDNHALTENLEKTTQLLRESQEDNQDLIRLLCEQEEVINQLRERVTTAEAPQRRQLIPMIPVTRRKNRCNSEVHMDPAEGENAAEHRADEDGDEGEGEDEEKYQSSDSEMHINPTEGDNAAAKRQRK